MREADDTALTRAALYVDTRAGALVEPRNSCRHRRGVIRRSDIKGELSDLVRAWFRAPDPEAITLFKSVGTAIEDLAAAELAVEASGPAP